METNGARPACYLVYGPGWALPDGNYTATFDVEGYSWATVEVRDVDSGFTWSQRLNGTDGRGNWSSLEIIFDATCGRHYEFRVYYEGTVGNYLRVWAVTVRRN